MSMNQYMHPRNIYKQAPNFKLLALQYPEFRKYAIQDISGKVTIDFKNAEALRALTCTLLKKDFGLDIEIPKNKLIPTVPLRLNYILWIEDLLNLAKKAENIKGIDIGTGASCIYPVIAAKKNKWFMLATEKDLESIKYATENVKRNSLENLIKIESVNGETLLEEVLKADENFYDFCMCNPPFFSKTEELHPFFKSRKQNRPHPKNAFCASVDEVVVKGGEVDYLTKLIHESVKLKTKILIYTTMIGHKYNLPILKRILRQIGVVSFKQTEFCQGHTTRWGLAWTFDNIDLTKIPDSLIQAKQKSGKPLLYEIPKVEGISYKLSVISERLVTLFKELQIEYQEIKHINNLVEFVIIAYSNTWSHQRRKKREKNRLRGALDIESGCDNNNLESSLEKNEVGDTCEKLSEMYVNTSPSSKRSHDAEDEDDGYYNIKKLKTDFNECLPNNTFLKAKISVVKVDSTIGLELIFYEGTGSKEALHQILQYLKNNLMKID